MSEQQSPNNKNPKHDSGATRNLALLLCLGTLAGVLIWAKLRLVTDIPRSAYADPRETEVLPDSEDDGLSVEDDHIEEPLEEFKERP